MTIAAIDSFALDVPLRAPAGPPGHARDSLPFLLVRVTTDDGVVGWGEAFAINLRDATRLVLERIAMPRCLGADETRIGAVTEPVARSYRNCRPGPLTYALSAIDIALWDIAAKRAGVPLRDLLGGGTARALPAYASLVRYGEPARAAAAAAEAVGRGYRQVKLHEAAYEPIAAVRGELGPGVPVMVDVSSAWTLPEALAMAPRLAALGLAWIEEPTWPPEDYAALAKVAADGGVPLAAGENATSLADFRHLCAASGAAVVQPSVGKLGGVTAMVEARAIAAQAGKAVVPHIYYLGPALLASLHLIAALAPESPVEHAVFETEGDPYSGALALVDGGFAVPTGPGLGLDPDPGFIARHRID